MVAQISSRLARRRHEVHVATGWPERAEKEAHLDGVRIHRFDVAGNAALGIKGEKERYLNFVASGKWDIVAMHCAQTWSTDVLLPEAESIGGKKIFVGHGLSELGNPVYQRYFQNFGKSLRKMDAIVALSSLLEEVAFCARNRLSRPQIICNGVDAAEWDQPPRNLRESWEIGRRPWLLSVSNHSPIKGHTVFFETIRRIRREHANAQGMIIGNSYPAAKWNLGARGIKGGCWYKCLLDARLNKDVILRWNVPRADVVSAIQEADVVLVTSSREASPLVVLESMAAATPWISFNVGAVRDHVGGMRVESLEEMVTSACQVLRDPELRKKLGSGGQYRIKEKHDWESICNQYEALYKSVAE